MDKLGVELGERSYPIYIDHDLLSRSGEILKRHLGSGQALVVSNPVVGPLYLDALIEGLRREGIEACSAVVPDGEKFKTLEWASMLYDSLLDQGIDRSSTIVALGGGVIGDLAGFVAATFKRGISFVQVPTTLLAQVDASIGGKVAVDHSRGKNLIGAFHQPKCVLISLGVLDTLPEREMRAGLAEVIKYGVIGDEELFAYLEDNLGALLGRDLETLRFVVKRSCQIKASVVAQDEREIGLRTTLNFGHTLGHAIEAAAGYRSYRHGEAVAIGMVLAAKIALQLQMTTQQTLLRISELLERAGLPTRSEGIAVDEMIGFLRHDKKVLDGRVRFVLPEKIGQVKITDAVSEKLIREVLKEQES